MSSFIALSEVQARLPEILAEMIPGQKLFVTGADGHPVATLIREPLPRKTARQPGSAAGKLVIVAEDDEHLKDFAEYME